MKQQVKRFLRTLAGRDYYPRIDIRCACARLGSTYGGWTFAEHHLDRDAIVYCVGIGEDISFDLALQQRFAVEIHGFDPTPKSLAWIRQQELPAGYHVHAYGLGNIDGRMLFRPPEKQEYVSYSLVEDPGRDPNAGGLIEAEIRRLATICRELSHTHVDLLKLDIEGAEYSVIDDLSCSSIHPRQLLIEFHHRLAGIGIQRTQAAVNALRDLGYGLFYVSPNGENYSFILRSVVLGRR